MCGLWDDWPFVAYQSFHILKFEGIYFLIKF